MNDLNHLKESVLLRQTGELPARQSEELDALLLGHPGAANFARDARTVMEIYKNSTAEVPPTPGLTLERILREGRKQAAIQSSSTSFWERQSRALRWAAAVAVTLVSAGAASFFLRDSSAPAPIAQSEPRPTAPSDVWKSFESDGFDLQLAQLDTRLNQPPFPSAEETESGLDEDSLAEALLFLEQESL